MYQFSIHWFRSIFVECIHEIQPSFDCWSERYGTQFWTYIKQMIGKFSLKIYQRVSWALTTEHQLPFAFLLCCSILKSGDEVLRANPSISHQEFSALIASQSEVEAADRTKTGNSKHDNLTKHKKLKKPEFITQRTWAVCDFLERMLPCFFGLQWHIVHHSDVWKNFYRSEDPAIFEFPVTFSGPAEARPLSDRRHSSAHHFIPSRLTSFQRLLLLKAFHPPHLLTAVRKFISEELGTKYVVQPLLNLRSIYEETTPFTPILFILAPSKSYTQL